MFNFLCFILVGLIISSCFKDTNLIKSEGKTSSMLNFFGIHSKPQEGKVVQI